MARIAFLCGSLDPGKNGVGDYCRRMATAFRDLGHVAVVISVNDCFIAQNAAAVRSETKGEYRISQNVAWDVREVEVFRILREFNPDWLSVQFVPFAFHPRGLCWEWLQIQKHLACEYRVHVMFHEIWVGWNMPVRLGARLLGIAQKQLMILSGIRSHSRLFTTHTPIYQQMLRGIAIESALIAIPSNIPRIAGTKESFRSTLLARLGIRDSGEVLVAGYFGTFLPAFCRTAFCEWIQDAAARYKRVVVLAAGQSNKNDARIWEEICESCRDFAQVLYLGELPPEEVSAYLHGLDVGLTTYPVELCTKSGSVAAMIEHGLPIIAFGSMRLGGKVKAISYSGQNALLLEPTRLCSELLTLLEHCTTECAALGEVGPPN